MIRTFLRRLTANAALADDLAQEAFIKAYKNFPSLKDKTASRAWLFQIAYRIYIDHIRKDIRRQDLVQSKLPPDDEHAARGKTKLQAFLSAYEKAD